MKRRFYLRGIGVGLVLAVVLYSTIIIPRKYELSDEEIMARAEKLGMVMEEEVTLPEPTPSEAPTPTEAEDITTTPDPTMPAKPTMPVKPTEPPEPTKEPTKIPTPTQVLMPTKAPTPTKEPTKIPTPTQAPTPTKAPAPTQEPNTGDGMIVLQVVKGMGSAQFALAAKEAGLVENAEEFDRYLIQNGYASNIRIGNYTFSAGASYYEIAEKVTSR